MNDLLDILDMIADVNPVEIGSQIGSNNLENWCDGFQNRIRKAILAYYESQFYKSHYKELTGQSRIKNHIETQTRKFAKAHECCGGCTE